MLTRLVPFACPLALVALAPALGAAPRKPAATPLPTGQRLTPLAAPGAKFEPLVTRGGPKPDYIADGAAAMALSPDGTRLAILTSGFNRYNGPGGGLDPKISQQYVLLYRLGATGAVHEQTLTVNNSFGGIAWASDGQGFAVGGGVDDKLYLFRRQGDGFAADGAPIALGHKAGNGAGVAPQAAGVAIAPDGRHALVANYYNDSVSLIDLAARRVIAEQDLRPGKIDPARSGTPGGSYPFAVAFTGAGTAWVSAARDRELIALAVSDTGLKVTARLRTIGEPTALLYDAPRGRLYATEDNDDRLAMADAATGRLLAEPRLGLPDSLGAAPGKGFNPNALALLPDGRLVVSYGGANAAALVAPGARDARVLGLVPTGWYPSAVAASRDGRRLFVANRKSPPGPNPLGCPPKVATVQAQPTACGAANQYIFQLEKAGLLQFPSPSPRALAATTLQAAANLGLNNGAERRRAAVVMAQLRTRIRHVVFIVKENRTYDQVLGDLEIGNGDPRLAILGERLSPNLHALARQFVTLDNFYDSGEQSSTGWTWTTAARTTDLLEKTAPVNYAGRGLSYESEQLDRNIATSLSPAERARANPKAGTDPDVLPGSALLTAPDGDEDDEAGRGAGFIWNAALKAGLTVRNYGFSSSVLDDRNNQGEALVREPFKAKRPIFQAADRALAPLSDPYFRGFDMRVPDYWRAEEWLREFGEQQAKGTMPRLTLLRLGGDHFGDFDKAIDGVNTVETQMADNDYAVGRVVEAIAKSRFAADTLVFVIEDDAQNGQDHVDARRSIAFVVGPYVKQKALVSTRYTTVHLVRTIGAVLGLKPLGLNDALAAPMADLFDLGQRDWTFTARPAAVLRTTQLPIPAATFADAGASLCRLRSADYWAQAMAGQDFAQEDRLDTDRFNAALWSGLGNGPVPSDRNGADLREGRARLLGAVPVGCPS
jgi:DNA-binding beta-propeller fold protein YncE